MRRELLDAMLEGKEKPVSDKAAAGFWILTGAVFIATGGWLAGAWSLGAALLGLGCFFLFAGTMA